MRKLLFHPITAMLVAVVLLLGLRDQMGVPRTGFAAVVFLALFGYGCGLIYLGMLYASPWFAVLKTMKFPEAGKNRVFRTGMALNAFTWKCLAVAAIAVYAFDARPPDVTRLFAALLALSTAAAVMPLTAAPETKTAP